MDHRKGAPPRAHRSVDLTAIAVVIIGILSIGGLFLGGPATPVHAATVSYVALLTGPAESPPNASPGIGFTKVDFDQATHTLRVQVDFSGLTGVTTAAHIHACTAAPGVGVAGVAVTLAGFPLGVTSGTYQNTFDTSLASTFSAAFITANGGAVASAEAVLATCLAEGRAYVNVHSPLFPGGEIRGFLVTPQGADLTVRNERKPGQPAPRAGGNLYYLVRVKNEGNRATPPPPRNVTLIDTPPAGTSVVSWSMIAGSGVCSLDGSGQLVCDLGASMAPGTETIVEVAIRTPSSGSLTNTARVDPHNRIAESDEFHNTATLVTNIP